LPAKALLEVPYIRGSPAPVVDMMEQSWESERPPSAATAPSPETRLRPPPPLTHEDNRGFLEMLREKKERYCY
jgi:hypothetical protein